MAALGDAIKFLNRFVSADHVEELIVDGRWPTWGHLEALWIVLEALWVSWAFTLYEAQRETLHAMLDSAGIVHVPGLGNDSRRLHNTLHCNMLQEQFALCFRI